MIVPVFPLFKDKDYDEALQYLTSKCSLVDRLCL